MTAMLRMLGDYNVIKQIGQGSLGCVYLVEHRFMKRHYVIKVLPDELATDRGFIQRFEDEVKLLATLDHPNIVKIHNVSFASGSYFLVTDCVVDAVGETTNLAQYMLSLKKRLAEEELVRLLRPVAEALDYAHQKLVAGQKLTHRSLKLNNILVGKGKGGACELFISDFGLSRIVGIGAVLSRTYKVLADALGIAAAVPVLGQPGQERYPSMPSETGKLTLLHTSFLQNYLFLAPEQKRLEDPRGVDAKADVYAFGVLVYYMITGEYPEGIFEPVSVKAPEYQLNWDAFIQRCLQSNPAKRPAHLVEALDYFTRLPSVEKAPAPVVEKEMVAVEVAVVQPEIAPVLPRSLPILKEEGESSAMKLVQKPVVEFESPSLERPLQPIQSSIMAQLVREATVTHYEPERKEKRQIEPLRTEMAVIPGGSYWRGSMKGNRDEMPRHQIVLRGFALDVHPVTNEQFVRFLEALGGEKDHQNNDIIRLRDSRIRRSSGKLSIESGYAKHPVVGVSWYGAMAYAKWIGRRLPTEAEWEIAACAGQEEAIYPTGEDIEKSQANFFSSDTTAVMSYAAGSYGLYDMAGNVYEWCQDWYDYTFYAVSAQEPDNPKGPMQGVYRVLKGGCWKSLKDDLRCSHRHRNNPGTVNRTYGFRCASNIEE